MPPRSRRSNYRRPVRRTRDRTGRPQYAKLRRAETGITAGVAAGVLTNLSTTLEAEGAGYELSGARLTSVRMSGYFAPTTLDENYYRPSLWLLPSSFDLADMDAIIRSYNSWYDRIFLGTGTSHLVAAGALEADRHRFTVRTPGPRVVKGFGTALFLYEEADNVNLIAAWEMTVRWEHA